MSPSVFGCPPQGFRRFHRLPPPSDEDVDALLARIVRRVRVVPGPTTADGRLWELVYTRKLGGALGLYNTTINCRY